MIKGTIKDYTITTLEELIELHSYISRPSNHRTQMGPQTIQEI